MAVVSRAAARWLPIAGADPGDSGPVGGGRAPTVAAVERVLGAVRSIGARFVAIDDRAPASFTLALQRSAPDLAWIGSSALLEPLRVIKASEEIERISKAAQRAEHAWHAFLEGPIAGLDEATLADRLKQELRTRAIDDPWVILASGPNSASPHHRPTRRVLSDGDVVVVDWGGTLGAYQADITRLIVVGTPPPSFAQAYAAALRAHDEAIRAFQPGARAADTDRAARDVIVGAGFAAGLLCRCGHGLGLDLHEPPYLSLGSNEIIAPGMVVTIEPGIYLAGQFGLRIEDTVVCTEDGHEVLTTLPVEPICIQS